MYFVVHEIMIYISYEAVIYLVSVLPQALRMVEADWLAWYMEMWLHDCLVFRDNEWAVTVCDGGERHSTKEQLSPA